MTATKRPYVESGYTEYAMATNKGLKFINFSPSAKNMSVLSTEVFFSGENVKSFVEYDID